MNTTVARPPVRSFRRRYLLAGVIVSPSVLFLCCTLGVASLFRLSSETAALRRSLVSEVEGTWNTKIAVRIGWVTAGVVRLASHLVSLPEEPRALLKTVRGAEVGVYELGQGPDVCNPRAMLAAADKAMARRGWERVVCVAQGRELVLVYMPGKGLSPRHTRCCISVWDGHQLVVGGVRGNVEPLLELATRHLQGCGTGPLAQLGEGWAGYSTRIR